MSNEAYGGVLRENGAIERGAGMGWSLGYDSNWRRDIGYGVPAFCDHPRCAEEIDRGLAYVCGSNPYGEDHGCGLFFCAKHLSYVRKGDGEWPQLCPRCIAHKAPYKRPKPDHPQWIRHKLTDPSWGPWREENPAEVEAMRVMLADVERNQRRGAA